MTVELASTQAELDTEQLDRIEAKLDNILDLFASVTNQIAPMIDKAMSNPIIAQFIN